MEARCSKCQGRKFLHIKIIPMQSQDINNIGLCVNCGTQIPDNKAFVSHTYSLNILIHGESITVDKYEAIKDCPDDIVPGGKA